MKKEFAQKLLQDNIETYEKIATEFNQTRQWIWPALKEVEAYINEGDRVLDLGCGNGRFFKLVKNTPKTDYLGVDSSTKLIEKARSEFPQANFKVADALELPFKEESFDIVIAIAVFHHIPGKDLRRQFLKEARRVLKKDGKLILTVWNLWQKDYLPLIFKFSTKKLLGKSKLDFKDVLKPWGEGSEKRYYHAFTRGELKRLLQKSNFHSIKTKYLKRNGDKANIVAYGEK